MNVLNKKLVVDAAGRPLEVIVPYEQFLEMEEALGLDLEAAVREDLETARADWEAGREDAFVSPDALR